MPDAVPEHKPDHIEIGGLVAQMRGEGSMIGPWAVWQVIPDLQRLIGAMAGDI